MDLTNIDLENIEFEDDDEDNKIRDFFTKESKPLTYNELIYMYKHIGIDIELYPALKKKVLEVQEKSKRKNNER